MRGLPEAAAVRGLCSSRRPPEVEAERGGGLQASRRHPFDRIGARLQQALRQQQPLLRRPAVGSVCFGVETCSSAREAVPPIARAAPMVPRLVRPCPSMLAVLPERNGEQGRAIRIHFFEGRRIPRHRSGLAAFCCGSSAMFGADKGADDLQGADGPSRRGFEPLRKVSESPPGVTQVRTSAGRIRSSRSGSLRKTERDDCLLNRLCERL
jgi:hypothetical protein